MSNSTPTGSATEELTNRIRYILLQICYIASIICCIFTLTHLFLDRNLRSALHNHIPIALLIISTFDAFLNHPFTLNYLRLGRVVPSSDPMCLFWNFINSLFTVSTFLTMAWGSIERYLLVFHSKLFTNARQRLLFHYIPLVNVILIYPIISHIMIFLLYPCQNQFNMRMLFCGYTCALKVRSVALYARIAHNFIPTFIVVSSTMTLLVTVITQKRRIQYNPFNWRRYRRMIIQLLALASVFLFVTLPATFVSVVQNCCSPTFAASIYVPYLNFLVRFLTMLIPFICLSLLPELWPKLLICRHPDRRRTNPT